MSSGTKLIQRALQQIGAHSVLAQANAEAIELGREELNDLLQFWTSQGFNLNITPIDESGDEVAEPSDARAAIVDNLSIALAPSFDNGKNVVSQTLKDNARDGYERIKGLYRVVTISTKVISSTTPLGQGNVTGNGFSNRRFKGTDGTVGQ